jgi:hypothetical protein
VKAHLKVKRIEIEYIVKKWQNKLMYFKENGQGEGKLTRHFDAHNYSGAITS